MTDNRIELDEPSQAVLREARSLLRRKERRKSGLFLVEGRQAVREALGVAAPTPPGCPAPVGGVVASPTPPAGPDRRARERTRWSGRSASRCRSRCRQSRKHSLCARMRAILQPGSSYQTVRRCWP